MAQHRHKRETNARRPKAFQVAGSVAILATVSAVSLGVLTANPPSNQEFLAASNSSANPLSNADARLSIVSRSESRLLTQQADDRAAKREARAESKAAAKAQAKVDAKREKREAEKEQLATVAALRRADTKMWTTTELNLWTSPDQDADNVGVIDGIEKVLVTGREANGRVEIVIDGKSRWVTAGYLSQEKPETGPTLGGSCTNGSSVSSGVDPGVVLVHQAVCSNFPEITSYGTFRSDGEHAQGRAVDVMVSGELGWQVADFLRANYAALDIEYLIYAQKIWSVERGGEGWRSMSDRGSATANHYDHVHVTVY